AVDAEAADPDLVLTRVDPQKALKQRRVVPVEELGEGEVKGTVGAARQVEEDPCHPTRSLADRDLPRARPRRGDPEPLGRDGRRLVGRNEEPPAAEPAELATVDL